jgi:uncharacterized membrane protein
MLYLERKLVFIVVLVFDFTAIKQKFFELIKKMKMDYNPLNVCFLFLGFIPFSGGHAGLPQR